MFSDNLGMIDISGDRLNLLQSCFLN